MAAGSPLLTPVALLFSFINIILIMNSLPSMSQLEVETGVGVGVDVGVDVGMVSQDVGMVSHEVFLTVDWTRPDGLLGAAGTAISKIGPISSTSSAPAELSHHDEYFAAVPARSGGARP